VVISSEEEFLNEWYARQEMEERVQYVTGIALSGAYFFNTLSDRTEDPMDAALNGVDQCFSNVSSTGQYYYNFWSPCLAKGKGLSSEK
jgi:hypothetical protein